MGGLRLPVLTGLVGFQAGFHNSCLAASGSTFFPDFVDAGMEVLGLRSRARASRKYD